MIDSVGILINKKANATKLIAEIKVAFEKLKQKAEVTVHLSGKDIYVESIDEDLYAAVDILADKLDRQIQKHKQKLQDHHRGEKMSHVEAE